MSASTKSSPAGCVANHSGRNSLNSDFERIHILAAARIRGETVGVNHHGFIAAAFLIGTCVLIAPQPGSAKQPAPSHRSPVKHVVDARECVDVGRRSATGQEPRLDLSTLLPLEKITAETNIACFLAQGGSEAMNNTGAHLVLSLDVAEAHAYWVSSLRDEIRHRLRAARIPFRVIALANNALQVRLAKPENTDAALKVLGDLAPAAPSGNFEGSPNVVRESQESDVVVAQGEGGNITIVPTEVGLERRASLMLDETVAIANRRLERMGITASAVRRGRDQIYVHAPSLQDTTQLKKLLTNSAQLTFHEVHPVIRAEQARQGRMPAGYKIYSGPAGELLLRELTVIRGNDLADAYAVLDQRTGEPVIGFRFSTVGAHAFARFTAASIGRRFAIVLGDVALSAPVIREAILDGAGQVSGNFTAEDVQQLAVLLRVGAMPAKLAVMEERIVPSDR